MRLSRSTKAVSRRPENLRACNVAELPTADDCSDKLEFVSGFGLDELSEESCWFNLSDGCPFTRWRGKTTSEMG